MSSNRSDPSHFELHIDVISSEQTALALLSENAPLSKQKLKKAMTNGAVWLESSIGIHRLRRAKKIIHTDDKIHLYYDEVIQTSIPAEAKLIADEGGYSIWNKPYGMYSQGTKWGDHCTIHRWAEQKLTPQRPAFPVHRLDRAANGLIILAHSKKMATAFLALFKMRKIQKQYTATVEGELEKSPLPFTLSSDIDGKSAISKIISIQKHNDNSCVIVEIETGRKHQIRRHLSEIGHPIIGDRLYGSKQQHPEQSEKNLQLQATSLKFNCPLTDEIREYSLNKLIKEKT